MHKSATKCNERLVKWCKNKHGASKIIDTLETYQVSIETKIPKAKFFRFENYWLNHSDFKSVVQAVWNIPVDFSDSAKRVNGKFKNLRRSLKLWAKNLPCLKKLISKVNEVIGMLDIFEEMRPLSTEEWNMRDILKSHVLTLLHNQNVYWKQRGKIKWVKLGNENTKFFHTKATINYRHNYISMLLNENQAEICDHDGKATILWNAFKERMGKSDSPQLHYNVQQLYGGSMDNETKDSLECPFTDEEIDEVIKELPNDKSPGRDGFNNEFVKSCWSIIADDIKSMIRDFYDEKINLESINSSFITLIPKTDNPSNAGDFRPISLLNTVLKFSQNC
jgi:hypothetical protein